MIVLPYAVCMSAFFIGWFLLVRAPVIRTWMAATAGILFFMSFTTSSLVFYVLPMAHLWWRADGDCWPRPWHFLRCYWPLLLLPFTFYALKVTFFRPYGDYEGYNALTGSGATVALFLVLATAVPLALLLLKRRRIDEEVIRVFLPFSAGAFMTALAIAPYISVGHFPPFKEWASRHELLLPLGIALILLACARGIGHLLGPGVAQGFAIAIVGCSVLASASIAHCSGRTGRSNSA